MSAICFVIAVILFAVKTFGGDVGGLDLLALGLMFVALGLLLGSGVVGWVQSRTVRQ